MNLSEGFLFNQSNLQDYVDCQRRFQLRHILHQSWPAVEAEPYLKNELLVDQGATFHKIIHQQLIGVPEAQISQSISSDDLIQLWWSNYLHTINNGILKFINEPGNLRFEEITLSIPINTFRLIAKYDLLVIRPDSKLIIADWKSSQNHPKHSWLADRMQTHVYPFVLTIAGSDFLGGNQADPGKIEMIYWFANQPEQPERFLYNQTSFQEDGGLLENLISSINYESEPVFPLTPDVKRCLYCTYRSLCNRGIKPGDLEHWEEWQEPEPIDEVSINFDQIGEIEL